MQSICLSGATAACLLFLNLVSTAAQAIAVSGQGTWETTLQGRDLDGNLSTSEAYYDTVLDITWLLDANASAGSSFDDGVSSTDGHMTWVSANSWAAGLNINGITGWRLPDIEPVNGTAFNTIVSFNGTTDRGHNISAPGTLYAGSTASEMAHMYYNTLGNLSPCNPAVSTECDELQSGWGLTNTGPFENLNAFGHWSATEGETSIGGAWYFNFNEGNQRRVAKSRERYAWAVHEGDVGWSLVPVPVPAAVWLFGSGLLGLAVVGTRRRHPGPGASSAAAL
jgi:hypothetical protein